MENKDYNRVAGSPQAPFFNKRLVPQGVLLRNIHAIGHPSEPNYLALFSGSTQGITGYDRNHNPWVDFRNVPKADNLVYRGWPSRVATFVWITPNLCHDMHDCSVRIGDKWLSENLPAIIGWDKANDGLLILTWDEAAPDNNGKNHVATVLVGPMIHAGSCDTQDVNHYSVSRTIEAIFRLRCIAKACSAPLIKGIWQ